MKKYALRVLIGLDQFINTLAGGYPNETLSARAWRKGNIEGKLGWKIFQEATDFMFHPLQPNHCEGSYVYFQQPTKTCGIYFPIYSGGTALAVGRADSLIPIDLPPTFDHLHSS